MRTNLVHWRNPLAVTLILILLITAVSLWVTEQVNQMEENTSFERLAEEAAEFTRSLELNMESDRAKLELIARVVGNAWQSDAAGLHALLDTYQGAGTFFSRLDLLLPGDEVITRGGARVDVSPTLSYEQEAGQGAHISDRELDWDGEGYVVRHCVPVEANGEIVAMLCGIIELEGVMLQLPYTPYGGEAAIYLIDGATGDFLIDTWHEELGNFWALGTRPMAEGYDDQKLRQGLVDGASEYVVFLSETTGEHLYFYYTPSGINQWRVALSVPEDVVFADARNIRSLLTLMLVLESVFFLLYVVCLIWYIRHETGEKQRQLNAVNDIYNVEKLLFNAHEHRENVIKSLEVIARMLPAKCVAFTMLMDDGPPLEYLWQKPDAAHGSALLAATEPLAEYFAAGHEEVSVHTPQEVRAILPDAPAGMNDLAAIPVEDAEGIIHGVLSATGLVKRTGCAAMLKSVGFSFSMLCGNTRTYRALQRQGERDALTGLYNRNRYELDQHRLGAKCRKGLGCVFLDANGLHELNNTLGHEAGDELLRTVAREIRNHFDARYAYRVGGDEFLIFSVDGEAEHMVSHSRAMVAALNGRGYSVSAGTAWCPAPVSDLKALVQAAEKRMYDDKGEYYSSPDRGRSSR